MSGPVVQGAAFFSTESFKREPRPLCTEIPPAVVHSNPDLDTRLMIEDLRSRWPIVCNSIFPGWDIRDFFDEYDFHVGGKEFLYDLITKMMKENEAACVKYCQDWSETHKEHFHLVFLVQDPAILFHVDDHSRWGWEFLCRALDYMKKAYLATMTKPKTRFGEDPNPKGVGKATNINKIATTSKPPTTLREYSFISTPNGSRTPAIVASYGPGMVPFPSLATPPMSSGIPFPSFGLNTSQASGPTGHVNPFAGPAMPSPQMFQQLGFNLVNQVFQGKHAGSGAIWNMNMPNLPYASLNQPPTKPFNKSTGRLEEPEHSFREQSDDQSGGGVRKLSNTRKRGRSFPHQSSGTRRSSLSQRQNPRPYRNTSDELNAARHRDSFGNNSSTNGNANPSSLTINAQGATTLNYVEHLRWLERNGAQVPLHVNQPVSLDQNADHGQWIDVVEPNSSRSVMPEFIGGDVDDVVELWVSDVDGLSEEQLRKAFETVIPVDSIRFHTPFPVSGQNAKPKCAYVKFFSTGDARSVLQMQQQVRIGERKLPVQVPYKFCNDIPRAYFRNGNESLFRSKACSSALKTENPASLQDKEQRSNLSSPTVGQNSPQINFSPQDARSDLPRVKEVHAHKPPYSSQDFPSKNKRHPKSSKNNLPTGQVRKSARTRNNSPISKYEFSGDEIGFEQSPSKAKILPVIPKPPTYASMASSKTRVEQEISKPARPSGRAQPMQDALPESDSQTQADSVSLVTSRKPTASSASDVATVSPIMVIDEPLNTKTQDIASPCPSSSSSTVVGASCICSDEKETTSVKSLVQGHAAFVPLRGSLDPQGVSSAVGAGDERGSTNWTTFQPTQPTTQDRAPLGSKHTPETSPDSSQRVTIYTTQGSPKEQTLSLSSEDVAGERSDKTQTPGTTTVEQLPWQKDYQQMLAIIANLAPDQQTEWLTAASMLKEDIERSEKILRGLNESISSKTKTQKKTIRTRITKNKEQYQNQVEDLYLLSGKIRHIQESNTGELGNALVKTTLTAQQNMGRWADESRSGEVLVVSHQEFDDIKERLGLEGGTWQISRTIEGALEEHREMIEQGATVLVTDSSGSTQPQEVIQSNCNEPFDGMPIDEPATRISPPRRMSYAKVAAALPPSTQNVEGNPIELGKSPDVSIPMSGRKSKARGIIGVTEKSKEIEVSWGVGPEGAWGEKGLLGKQGG